MKPVTGNFTGYRLTGNRLTTLKLNQQQCNVYCSWNKVLDCHQAQLSIQFITIPEMYHNNVSE